MREVDMEVRPEPRGLLVEPPRWPPVAIGAATAPPPSHGTTNRTTRRIAAIASRARAA